MDLKITVTFGNFHSEWVEPQPVYKSYLSHPHWLSKLFHPSLGKSGLPFPLARGLEEVGSRRSWPHHQSLVSSCQFFISGGLGGSVGNVSGNVSRNYLQAVDCGASVCDSESQNFGSLPEARMHLDIQSGRRSTVWSGQGQLHPRRYTRAVLSWGPLQLQPRLFLVLPWWQSGPRWLLWGLLWSSGFPSPSNPQSEVHLVGYRQIRFSGWRGDFVVHPAWQQRTHSVHVLPL